MRSPDPRVGHFASRFARGFTSCAPALAALVALAACGPGETIDVTSRDAVIDTVAPDEGPTTPPCEDSTQTRCGAACVDIQTDANNCGACGAACPTVAGGTARCVSGACVAVCTDGRANCDGMLENGCEAALEGDTANCGACGLACAGVDNGTPGCGMGACTVACSEGFGDCDMYYESGCEAATGSDLDNCGACGNRCPWPARTTLACADSTCGFTCRRNYENCDREAPNGCEVSLISARNCGRCGVACDAATRYCAETEAGISCVSTCPADTTDCDFACIHTERDPDNCGACNNVCPGGDNAQPACSMGMCTLECRPGWANCDGDAANGCETNLAVSVNNCGACGNVCVGGLNGDAFCSAGMCRVRCRPGTLDCDRSGATGCEVSPATDVNNCGACGRACPSPDNAAPTCTASACGFTCNAGFANCDRNAANGCETSVLNNPANCGACGRACRGGESCQMGTCVRTSCAPGQGNCDSSADQSCETALLTSMAHCGACGSACTRANARSSCVGGGCVLNACNAGFGNCDGNAVNGCETDLSAVSSCGACGTRCATANGVPACTAGRCAVGSCNAGFGNCDANAANGCETNLQGSTRHCGACGNACAPGQSCVMGSCRGVVMPPMDGGVTPDAGPGMDSGPGMDAGMDAGMDSAVDAMAPADVQPDQAADMGAPETGPVCSGTQVECGAGNCVDLQSNTMHCGACGNACPAGQVCNAGACGLVCAMGRTVCGTGSMMTCVDRQTDSANCGACGNACPAGQSCVAGVCSCPTGQTLCGGACVNTSADNMNCGACGTVCTGGTGCSTGMCRCPTGQTLCGGTCVNTDSDRVNCGMCGRACPAGQLCSAGVCGLTCSGGRTACGAGAMMVCADLQTDSAHCGTCTTVCGAVPGTTMVSCMTGTCRATCSAGRGNCDNVYANGCEVNTQTSTAHCGGCGMACPATLPGASAVTCTAGACAPTCAMGRGNCDMNNANGCEVDTQTSAAHCGACGNACTGGRVCVAGACQCPTGQTLCGGACVNTQTSTAHCGGCGMACPATAANASAVTCTAGACRPTCNANFGNCNAMVGDGCEVDTRTATANCGTCGNACTGGRVCTASMCACPAGQTLCAGACVNTATSNAHCGTCGNACTGGQSCSGGMCRCPTGQTLCAGACVDTQTNLAHCGACGNACNTRTPNSSGASCTAGVCTPTCNANFANCNAMPDDGCEVNLQTDNINCGRCGMICGRPTTCMSGACASGACPTGMVTVATGTYTPLDNAGNPTTSTTVPTFCMARYEVTVSEYMACVTAGACTAPAGGTYPSMPSMPVNNVSYTQAAAYCTWRGNRLPTNVEWQWAARSRTNGTTYPWGNEAPMTSDSPKRACWNVAAVCTLGAYSVDTASPGIADLAGNLTEWVRRPAGGQCLAGGSYDVTAGTTYIMRAFSCRDYPASFTYASTGFRCAQ